MKRSIKISEQEADALLEERVAAWFDLPSCSCGGFFEALPEARQNIIICITDEGCFIRAREDLVKSEDGVFVGWLEDGEDLPNFGDVFKIREL